MIPVAYDSASATTRPQLPKARKLVLQSLFYGIVLTGGTLTWIFCLDHAQLLKHPISLYGGCNAETRGFIWFDLVMVTEMAIFSVRAPSFLLFSLPSFALMGSVLLTIIVSALIAIFASELHLDNMFYIVAFNIALLLVVDVFKIWFRQLIHDEPGGVIESDELIPVDVEVTETKKLVGKAQRYMIHRESAMNAADFQHQIEIVEERPGVIGGLSKTLSDLRPMGITSGFIDTRKHHMQVFEAPVPPGGSGPSVETVTRTSFR